MPRPRRIILPDHYQHVLNRGHNRQQIFYDESDYDQFCSTVRNATIKFDLNIAAFCLMPNHWHFVVKPDSREQLSASIGWISSLHAQYLRTKFKTKGLGAIYQGRYKSFFIPQSALRDVVRYVERNALTAGLVENSKEWNYGSLSSAPKIPIQKTEFQNRPDWSRYVDQIISAKEEKNWLKSLKKQKMLV